MYLLLDRFSSFVFHFFCCVFLFHLLFPVFLVYLPVFSFLKSFLFVPQKSVSFMLVSLLPISFFQQNISCLLSHSLCFFQHFFQNKSFFSWYLISFFGVPWKRKISLFKFPFWSSSFLYLCFSFLTKRSKSSKNIHKYSINLNNK